MGLPELAFREQTAVSRLRRLLPVVEKDRPVRPVLILSTLSDAVYGALTYQKNFITYVSSVKSLVLKVRVT